MIQRLIRRVFYRQAELQPLNQRILFVHIPKCGGTSLTHAIRDACFPPETRDAFVLDSMSSAAAAEFVGQGLLEYRQLLLHYFLMHPKLRFVTGHTGISSATCEHFHDQWFLLTVLRHPVDRWYSHYFYNRATNSNKFHAFQVPESIAEYAFSDAGAGLGSLYVRHLTAGLDPADSTAAAIETLNRMDLVGVLEYPEDLMQRIRNQLGVQLDLPVMRANPQRHDAEEREVTPEVQARVESICEPDMEIYRHALKMAGLPQP